MGMDGTGLSVADALALQDRGCRNDDGAGWGDGGFMWVFFLFFLLAWGGNGFFGGNGMNGGAAGAALTRADLCDGFNFQNVENGIRGVQNGMCDGFYAMNTSMLNGFAGVNNSLCQGFNSVNGNISQLGYQMQDCCCQTNRNIDAVRYENAQNTCDIIQAANANTQRIVDIMTQNEIQGLRDELQSAQLTLGNAQQTTNIINALRPVAQPAYITCSPYESAGLASAALFGGCGCGCGC